MGLAAKKFSKQLINITRGASGAGWDVGSDGDTFIISDDIVNPIRKIQVTSNDVYLAGDNGFSLNVKNTGIEIGGLSLYANDIAAAAGGLSLGELYINSTTGAITQRGDTTVKVYKALITQSGTDDPVVTVLQNTIGNIV